MIRRSGRSLARWELLIPLALGILTLLSFWPVGRCGFVDLDDYGYVAGNGYVKSGFTYNGLIWAFNGFHAGHWIPMTWLSLMADAEIFGTQAAGFHWTNLFLHMGNVLLLFLVMRRATGSIWRSALVAALFGLHPLRVESVAWVTERKDVLAAFFGLSALAAYIPFTRTPSRWRYLSIMVLFVVSLMAKPMLVMLPVLMLLLDYWPLARMKNPFERGEGAADAGGTGDHRRSIGSLVLEKVPLFLLAAADSAVASMAQGRTAAASLEDYGVVARVSNAVVSYVRYVWYLVSFQHLAIFYPVHALPTLLVVADALLLAVATVLILSQWKRRPWLFIGWLWFILTMLPMIGLVQIGQQAMADRFSYFPTIGLVVMLVWSVPQGLLKSGARRLAAWGVTAAVLIVLCASTWRQTTYWKDSVTLFQHAVDVTDNNYMAYTYLGASLAMKKDYDGALHNLLTASRINPGYNFAQNNLGTVLAELGRTEEAMAQFQLALRTNPRSDNAQFNVGYLLTKMGRSDEAIEHLKQALEINPDHLLARFRLGLELQRRGDTAAAIEHFQLALLMSPDSAEIHSSLGSAYETEGRIPAAIAEYESAVRLAPRSTEACVRLGAILTRTGDVDRAIGYFEQALAIRPNDASARSGLEKAQALKNGGR